MLKSIMAEIPPTTPLQFISNHNSQTDTSPVRNIGKKKAFAVENKKTTYSLSVIGIANSVELFKGDIR
jgi:hypothetical protein